MNNYGSMPKVFLDGIELEYVHSLEYSRDTQKVEPFMGDEVRYFYSEPFARMRIESAYITIEAPIEYTEYNDKNEVFIYGPLRKAFPALFKARELKPWQLDYVKRMPGYKPRSELKYFNDDDIFTTVEAAWFKKGWKAHESITK
jgi:hypothetical protein